MLIGTVFNNFRYPDSQLLVDEGVLIYVTRVRDQLMFLHTFLMFANFIQFNDKIKNEGIKHGCTFIAMMFYQMVVISVGSAVFYMPRPKECRNLSTGCVVMWL